MDKDERDPRWRELRRYVENGKYLDRISFDSDGLPYVAGDWPWNRRNPDREEYIEEKTSDD